MKNLKFIICSFLMLAMVANATNATAQGKGYVHTVKSYNYGKIIPYAAIQVVTTPDATPVVIDTIRVVDNTSGMIEVICVGSSSVGDGITGKLLYRWKKTAGTITLSSATAVMAIVADTNLSGGTFALSATTSNNLKLTITGKAGVPVRWRSVMIPYYNL